MIHRYKLRGPANPALALRVLNLFAQLDLVCSRVLVTKCGDFVEILIEQAGLCPTQADRILQKMRMLFLVETAELAQSD